MTPGGRVRLHRRRRRRHLRVAPVPYDPCYPNTGGTVSADADCLFCKIAGGQIPADVVRESEHTLAFRDISPQAPTHVLVIPREHHRDVASLAAAAPGTLAELVREAAAVAAGEGIEAYRLVFNTGSEAGQSVFHVHGHVLGGRAMTWPPG
ncbi:histidine triad nucleotide-binding protein [Jiangella ureilytica]|uniref:Histidine triad nucleotide-binding protein n=1 Tax=Jiangella ureilytica TaxID=2530374 RepID=A0A4R4RFR8_9ACTN|nr:histidine triad nucleotide-binding protein [Jiangella ureilytica]